MSTEPQDFKEFCERLSRALECEEVRWPFLFIKMVHGLLRMDYFGSEEDPLDEHSFLGFHRPTLEKYLYIGATTLLQNAGHETPLPHTIYTHLYNNESSFEWMIFSKRNKQAPRGLEESLELLGELLRLGLNFDDSLQQRILGALAE